MIQLQKDNVIFSVEQGSKEELNLRREGFYALGETAPTVESVSLKAEQAEKELKSKEAAIKRRDKQIQDLKKTIAEAQKAQAVQEAKK